MVYISSDSAQLGLTKEAVRFRSQYDLPSPVSSEQLLCVINTYIVVNFVIYNSFFLIFM